MEALESEEETDGSGQRAEAEAVALSWRELGLAMSQFLGGLGLALLAAEYVSKRHRNVWRALHLCTVAVCAAQ